MPLLELTIQRKPNKTRTQVRKVPNARETKAKASVQWMYSRYVRVLEPNGMRDQRTPAHAIRTSQEKCYFKGIKLVVIQCGKFEGKLCCFCHHFQWLSMASLAVLNPFRCFFVRSCSPARRACLSRTIDIDIFNSHLIFSYAARRVTPSPALVLPPVALRHQQSANRSSATKWKTLENAISYFMSVAQ